MPYIAPGLRKHLEPKPPWPITGGELNFVISRLVDRYVEVHGKLSYQVITDIRGALVGALSEFDRLVAHPYEDQKRYENGDVWDASTELLSASPIL